MAYEPSVAPGSRGGRPARGARTRRGRDDERTGGEEHRHAQSGPPARPPRPGSRARHECKIIGSGGSRDRCALLRAGAAADRRRVPVGRARARRGRRSHPRRGAVAVPSRHAATERRLPHDALHALAFGVRLVGAAPEAFPVEADQIGPRALQPVEVVGAQRAPQVQRHAVDGDRTGLRAGLDHLAQLTVGVGEPRQHGRHQDPAPDAQVGQPPQRLDPPVRRGSARLGQRPHGTVECADGEAHGRHRCAPTRPRAARRRAARGSTWSGC